MNSRKVQAQMQIDVSFLSDTTQLVKQLQSATSQLKLDGNFGKQFSAELTKSFKEVNTIMSKMTEGLSKKGLSTKEYTNFFNEMHAKLKESIKFTEGLKQKMEDIYNSPNNKQGLKDLKDLRDVLKQINDLASDNQTALTRKQTAIDKMREQTGLDYNISKRTLSQIAGRRADKKGLTKTQQEWMGAHHLDETQLKRALELRKQILAHDKKINDLAEESYRLTKQKSIEAGQESVLKDIANLEKNTMSQDTYKHNLGILNNISPLAKDFGNVVNNLIPRFNTELQEGGVRAEKLAAAGSTINEIFSQFGLNFSVAAMLMKFRDLAVESFNFYKSLDSALNEIYVVSNLTSDAVNGLTADFLSMSKKTGMALDDVTRSATLFYQQGLNTEEVMEMTEVTSQFAKVAGIDATEAADKLTAAVNGYCLAAEDASLVADKFNKVAAASAADIDELSTAFSKAAAQANQAGVGMDNYLAYIATMVEATREAPENIGTSLKTIMSRMQQIKDAGTSEDGETDVNQVETALKSVGVALRGANGELRNLEDVFADLGPKWASLDRNTQAYLGTIIAGTRQQSRFITLMQNWDRVLDLADQSANSAGQQALMHAKAMDSITSKTQQLQVAWQEFVSNLTESDFLKDIIVGLTKLVDLFNDGNKPLALFSLGVVALGKKIKDLQPIINEKFGWFFNAGKDKRSGLGLIGELGQGGSAVSGMALTGKDMWNATKLKIEEISLNNQLKKVQGQLNENNAEERQNQLLQEQLDLETKIANNKEKQEILDKKGLENKMKFKQSASAFGSGLSKLGMGLSIGGMMLGSTDANAGGIMTSAGSVATTIGQFATGQWVTGLVSAAMSIYQITQTIDNWDENIQKRIKESVSAIGDAVGEANNINTGIKATEDLLKNYDELSSKLYKTQEEQELLNNTVQQLGDTYGIDVLSDAYGNLSINIAEVNEQLEIQKDKRKEALSELREVERENVSKALKGLGNDTTLGEVTNEIFSASAADYRSLLTGLEDGLTAESRNVADNVAKAFNSNLKMSIVNKVRNNATDYVAEGLGDSILAIEEQLNTSVSSRAWNDLYARIDFLEKNVNDMTYDEAQDYLSHFYDEWAERNSSIKENWDILVDSINNTVFENKTLIEFYDKVNELSAKASGDYWENSEQTGKLDKAHQALADQIELYNSLVGHNNKIKALVPGGWDDSLDPDEMAKYVEEGSAEMPDGWAVDLFRNNEADDVMDDLKLMLENYKEYKKEQEEFLKEYAKENGLLDEEDAKAHIQALEDISNALQTVTGETQTYLGSLEEFYNADGLSGAEAAQHATFIQQTIEGMNGLGANATSADRYNFLAEFYNKNKKTMKSGVKKQWQEIIEEAFNELEVSTPKTLTEITKELDSIGSGLVKMNDIISEFQEAGGLALDTFEELAGIIDKINLEDLGKLDPKAIDTYADAIDNLNLAYDANSGYITMNGDALTSLQQIQEIQTKSKIASMIADLKASRATTDTQIAYIDAQIAATDAAIKAAEMDGKSSIESNKVKDAANTVFSANFDKYMTDITEGYENDAVNQGEWSTTILSNLGTVADAWSKYFTGIKNGSTTDLNEVKKKAKNILKDVEYTWEGGGSYSGIDWDSYGTITKGSEEQKKLLSELNEYRTKLENTKKSYQATLKLTDAEISLLSDMYNSDLSAWGSKGEAEELDKYIGKLKEIYNILNRIQLLEHRLGTLDTYSEIAKGQEFGEYFQQRLDYTEELTDQYRFLVEEQKKFTNGYKDFIEKSAVGDVFDFDEFGQIIINFEKYNALQDTAADGAKSLKEQADEMYDEYTSMFEELHGYFDEYVSYLQKAIDLNNQIIDAYVNVENKMAAAIKEIYQKILDTKLEAIDQEKEALEELREAREKARKDQDNAKALSNLQTNMQRAMMDSSGASDISFIKAQQDMNDKLEEIADDKYSEMLDDIISQLDEEQEALQENFDQLFSNQEWLFDFLEKNVMNDKDKIEEILTQTEEWATSSDNARKEQLKELDTNYHTYMSELSGGSTIGDVWNRLGDLEKATKDLDEALKTREINVGNAVANAIANGISAATGGGNGEGGNYTPTNYDRTANLDYEEERKGYDVVTDYYSGAYNEDVKNGTFSTTDHQGHRYQPNNVKGSKLTDTKLNAADVGIFKNTSGVDVSGQNLWKAANGTYWIWNGSKNMYEEAKFLVTGCYSNLTTLKDLKSMNVSTANKAWDILVNDLLKKGLYGNGGVKPYAVGAKFATGGFANFTGPAWLDGTPQKPEAVLNALQTEHFIKFTNALDNMYGLGNPTNNTSSVSIDTISFNVESMSSTEDGEKAFNMFVDKFKEIGNRTGIKIDTFKNTL